VEAFLCPLYLYVVGRASVTAGDYDRFAPLGPQGLKPLHKNGRKADTVAAGTFKFPEFEMLGYLKVVKAF